MPDLPKFPSLFNLTTLYFCIGFNRTQKYQVTRPPFKANPIWPWPVILHPNLSYTSFTFTIREAIWQIGVIYIAATSPLLISSVVIVVARAHLLPPNDDHLRIKAGKMD